MVMAEGVEWLFVMHSTKQRTVRNVVLLICRQSAEGTGAFQPESTEAYTRKRTPEAQRHAQWQGGTQEKAFKAHCQRHALQPDTASLPARQEARTVAGLQHLMVFHCKRR